MTKSRAQIIATIGPSSNKKEMLLAMVENGMDVVRLNLSWADLADHKKHIGLIREIEKELKIKIPIILDLPGPRVQKGKSHTYNKKIESVLTKQDKEFLEFGVKNEVDYFAISFVGSAEDVLIYEDALNTISGSQRLIAKIERKIAWENIDNILDVADAVMVARGDLGLEIPIEQIPFIQSEIINKTTTERKPVIVATQMMLSMVHSPEPTRAEVTDVNNAILQGADAVMLSDETAIGDYPDLVVGIMDKVILESEKHEDLLVKPL